MGVEHMAGIAFMLWTVFLFLALALWNYVLGSLGGQVPEFFGYAAYPILFTAIVGWVNAGYDLFQVIQQTRGERPRSRRWPY